MRNLETRAELLHHFAAVIGGYLGVYAILCRSDLFGNAQTANMIYVVTGLVGHDFFGAMLRILGVLIYAIGVALTVYASKKWHWNLHILSLCVTACAILLLGMMPQHINDIIGLYPIFFTMAVQWNSFPGAYGYASSTIFSTNNIRQFVMALSEYSITKERKLLLKARFFGGSLLCFHFGVLCAYLLYQLMDYRCVWLCGLFLLAPAVLTAQECHQTAKHTENEGCLLMQPDSAK